MNLTKNIPPSSNLSNKKTFYLISPFPQIKEYKAHKAQRNMSKSLDKFIQFMQKAQRELKLVYVLSQCRATFFGLRSLKKIFNFSLQLFRKILSFSNLFGVF